MKNLLGFSRSLRTSVVTVILLFFVVLLQSNTAKAQCPSDISPIVTDINYTPWIGPVTAQPYPIPNTNCVITATYCYRTVCVDVQNWPNCGQFIYQAYIDGFTMTGTDCGNLAILTYFDIY